MADISIRELRNNGGEVVDRALKGERLTVTRAGKPVAELGPLPRAPKALTILLQSRRNLPAVDPDQLRQDLDTYLDPTL